MKLIAPTVNPFAGFVLLVALSSLIGCADRLSQRHTSAPEVTAPVSSDLDAAGSDLSRADGKAVVIRDWLNQH